MTRAAVPTIWTIGHSTRTFEEFRQLLEGNDITLLADVRRFPGSRRVPQFNADTLPAELVRYGIRYEAMPELGGRRRPRPDSRNLAWRNESFRGYADYTETPEFEAGIERLITLAMASRTAIMCAEAVWWRCHRALIADRLLWLGFEVRHIVSASPATVHTYTSPARIRDGRLSYEADPA